MPNTGWTMAPSTRHSRPALRRSASGPTESPPLRFGRRPDLQDKEALGGREIHTAADAGRDARARRQRLKEIGFGHESAGGGVAPRDLFLSRRCSTMRSWSMRMFLDAHEHDAEAVVQGPVTG